MELPELPEPMFWRNNSSAEEGGAGASIMTKNKEGNDEEIAWLYLPGHGDHFPDTYECVSGPEGVREDFFRSPAQTEEEAINMIVAFALMGVTKDV